MTSSHEATEPIVTDHPDRGRFEIEVHGRIAGYAEYQRSGDTIDFTHTEIGDEFEGQGLGSTLIRAALDTTREHGWAALPHCPFVKRFIERHDEYRALVPPDRRAQFGLAP